MRHIGPKKGSGEYAALLFANKLMQQNPRAKSIVNNTQVMETKMNTTQIDIIAETVHTDGSITSIGVDVEGRLARRTMTGNGVSGWVTTSRDEVLRAWSLADLPDLIEQISRALWDLHGLEEEILGGHMGPAAVEAVKWLLKALSEAQIREEHLLYEETRA